MKLNVIERINLLGLLPAEANLVTFRVVADLKKNLSFSEKELKETGIEQKMVNGEPRVFWKKNISKEIPVGPQALIIIQSALQEIDKKKKVTEGNFSLFEKFKVESLEDKKG